MTNSDDQAQARMHMRAARRRAGRLYRELGNRLVELRPTTAEDLEASTLLVHIMAEDLAKALAKLPKDGSA